MAARWSRNVCTSATNQYAAWEQLLYSVKTGGIAFDRVFGVSRWQYNAEHPEQASAFDEAMASFNSIVANAVVNSYDFSSCGKLVDVGGGNGSILAAILKVHPGLRGVLADLPHVLDGAQRLAWPRRSQGHKSDFHGH